MKQIQHHLRRRCGFSGKEALKRVPDRFRNKLPARVLAVVFILVVEPARHRVVGIIAEGKYLKQKRVQLVVAQIEDIEPARDIVMLAVDVSHVAAEIVVVAEAVGIPHLNIPADAVLRMTCLSAAQRRGIVEIFYIIIADQNAEHIQKADLARNTFAEVEQIDHAHAQQRARPVAGVSEKQLVVIKAAVGFGVTLHNADRLSAGGVRVKNTRGELRPLNCSETRISDHFGRHKVLIARKLTRFKNFGDLVRVPSRQVVNVSFAAGSVAEHTAESDGFINFALSAHRIKPGSLTQPFKGDIADRLVVVIDGVLLV